MLQASYGKIDSFSCKAICLHGDKTQARDILVKPPLQQNQSM